MPQIGIHANCIKDEKDWWHPDGTGEIYTDRSSNGIPCDTPLKPQKQIQDVEGFSVTMTPSGRYNIPRCLGKVAWDLENDRTATCPECGCVYTIHESG